LKKIFALLIIFATFSVNTAHSQETAALDKAIQEAAAYLDTRLSAGSVVAVLNVKSDNQALSSYIIGELVNAIINRGNLVPVDRENLSLIQGELQFHLSGDVSDESAQAIGKILGAQTIISGEVIVMNNKMYRLEIKAISVETAAIQGTVNKNIQVDKKLKTITGSEGKFSVSIGGGVRVGGSFTEGTHEEKGSEGIGGLMRDYTITTTNNKSAFDIGGFIFLDLKYAEINASMYNGSGNSRRSWKKDYKDKTIPAENTNDTTGNFSTLLLNIGVLAKYPFNLNNKITLFPALGADYQLWLLHTENKKKTPGDLSANNALWLKLGGGMDYHFTRSFFLRTELLWGAKFPSKNERGDSFKYFTHSPVAHIGLGYTF